MNVKLLEEEPKLPLIKNESEYIYFKLENKKSYVSFSHLDEDLKSKRLEYPFFIEITQDSWDVWFFGAITKEDIEYFINIDLYDYKKYLDNMLQKLSEIE